MADEIIYAVDWGIMAGMPADWMVKSPGNTLTSPKEMKHAAHRRADRIKALRDQRVATLEKLKYFMKGDDWRSVAEQANNLREIDAELVGLWA